MRNAKAEIIKGHFFFPAPGRQQNSGPKRPPNMIIILQFFSPVNRPLSFPCVFLYFAQLQSQHFI